MSSISFEQLSTAMRQYLTERAGNYDFMTARDVYNEVPSELLHDEKLVYNYMKGNEAIGVEPHELMHDVSEANGGLDVPENIRFGPRSINRSIGQRDMNGLDHAQVDAANEAAVDKLLEADPSDLLDAGEVATDVLLGGTAAAEATEVTSITAEAAEAGESLVGDALGLVAETAVAGIAAFKVGSYVHENLPSDWCADDKVAATAGASVGTALLAFTPVGQAAIACYAGYKLLTFGGKLLNKFAS